MIQFLKSITFMGCAV